MSSYTFLLRTFLSPYFAESCTVLNSVNPCRWNAIVVNGHDVEALCKAFHDAANTQGKPTCLIAQTFKGRGIPGNFRILICYLVSEFSL